MCDVLYVCALAERSATVRCRLSSRNVKREHYTAATDLSCAVVKGFDVRNVLHFNIHDLPSPSWGKNMVYCTGASLRLNTLIL